MIRQPGVVFLGIVFGLNLATPATIIALEWARLGHRPEWGLLVAVAAWQAAVAGLTCWAAWLLWRPDRPEGP